MKKEYGLIAIPSEANYFFIKSNHIDVYRACFITTQTNFEYEIA